MHVISMTYYWWCKTCHLTKAVFARFLHREVTYPSPSTSPPPTPTPVYHYYLSSFFGTKSLTKSSSHSRERREELSSTSCSGRGRGVQGGGSVSVNYLEFFYKEDFSSLSHLFIYLFMSVSAQAYLYSTLCCKPNYVIYFIALIVWALVILLGWL